MKKIKLGFVVFCFLSVAVGINVYGEDPLELDWEDLVPKDFVPRNPLDELSDEEYASLTDDSEKAKALMSEMQRLRDTAPVVADLDGKTVKIPGFVVPLDFDAKQVREFLLVPYFGACIHVPPPPANQIVYVQSEEGIDIDEMWDPINVVGELKTIHVSSELGEAGYSIEATEILPYNSIE